MKTKKTLQKGMHRRTDMSKKIIRATVKIADQDTGEEKQRGIAVDPAAQGRSGNIKKRSRSRLVAGTRSAAVLKEHFKNKRIGKRRKRTGIIREYGMIGAAGRTKNDTNP